MLSNLINEAGCIFYKCVARELVDIKELLKSVKTKKIKGVALDMIYCVESACLDEEMIWKIVL